MTNPTPQIPTLTTTALRLWARSKTDLPALAPPTRALSTALKHLKFEVADPDSVLNSPRGPAYLRQLVPVVEDCDFALRQVEAVLERHERGALGEEEKGGVIGAVERRLESVRVGVGLFLDTVQLQSSERERASGVIGVGGGKEGEGGRLDEIKDKVDKIAKKIFARRDSGIGDDEDEDALWERFRDELVREGFAPQVLWKHKEVLRAYIRELESAETLEDGQPVSVRGLLERPHPIITAPSHNPPTYESPQDLYPGTEYPAPPPYPTDGLAVTKRPSSPSSPPPSPARSLITTNDLLAPELPAPDLPTQFNGMYVSPEVMQAIQSYVPSGSPEQHLSPDKDGGQALGSSPRFVPPLPEGGRGFSKLQPDQNGREIPPDATWTRIRRALVSPVVLDRAGVRYEARPEFVAVLGVLSREEIQEFARQSEEVRRARRRPRPAYPSETESSGSESETGSESPPPVPRRPGEEARVGAEVEDKGTRSYPFIVQPPSEGEEPASPASTVKPKPILKNKNENRVHFGPDPYETPKDEPGKDRRRRRRRRDREYDRDRDHDRERDRDRDRDRDRERERERERDYDRDRERDRDYDRDRDRDREHRRRHAHRDGHRDSHRERDRERERERKRSGRDALYAAGLGGAAASLMGVLAEAASAL